MESETIHTFEVDEDGFVELGHLERDWFFLTEMRRQAQELAAGIERAEEMFQRTMLAAGATGFKINGVRKVTYKQDATFPVKKYTEAHPAVAEAYMVMKPAFDLQKFKEHRPTEYEQWRGRSFKFIQQTRK